ncbi:MAG: hypothetical protein LBC59_01970 [Chitinispirillales bacterium]|nr:hypothetical protein [Chitinispirillales bacterium]
MNAFRGKMFLSAFCVASLLAFAVEALCFNYKHYLKYFAGAEFHTTEVSPQDPLILLTSDGVTAKILFDQNDSAVIASGVKFTGIDRYVTSVFVQPIFNKYKQLEMRIRWTDEESTRELTRTLDKTIPYDNYTAIQTCGNVSELTIIFSGRIFFDEISQIAVNRQIPFYFSGLRLLVVSLLFFAIILFAYKPLRAKAAYYLFEYKFDPANKKQNVIYVCLVILILFFSWFCDYTSVFEDYANTPMNLQYNKYLVDALIAGKTNIDFGHPEKFLSAERPYDDVWRFANGYEFGVDWAWDISYYKGKYYTYYGVVPVVLLYLPYKLITGNYLSHNSAIFVFTVITVIFLALLWRFLVKKYMPNARFAFYLLSFLALFFVSRLSDCLRVPNMWTIVIVAGLAFTVAGTFLLLKSIDKENINRLQLFFACLCLALAVGCRPNMVFVSIIVPAVLWKRRSWKLAMFILIPYIMVAVPICLYNYVRFDSIFEFGHRYCTGTSNGTTGHLLNPLGKIHRMFITFTFYLFRLYGYSLHFPFVHPILANNLVTSSLGFIWIRDPGAGLINFPILFCLLYLFKNILSKNKPNGFYLSSVFFIITAVMIILYSKMGIFHGRYLLDCAVFLIFSSLFCAYYWCDYKHGDLYRSAVRLKIVYVLLIVSIFVGLFLFVSGSYYDMTVYRYLDYSLGIIEKAP